MNQNLENDNKTKMFFFPLKIILIFNICINEEGGGGLVYSML